MIMLVKKRKSYNAKDFFLSFLLKQWKEENENYKKKIMFLINLWFRKLDI